MWRYLDPFYHFDRWWESNIGKGGWAKMIAEFLYAVIVAVVLYKLLSFLLGTPRPLVVVASSSMEPTLYPGDILLVVGVDPCEVNATTVEVNVTKHPLRPEDVNLVVAGTVPMVNWKPLPPRGEVIVYEDRIRGRDIVHRAILKVVTPKGCYLLTQGDNRRTNPLPDQFGGIYPFLVSDEVLGKPVLVIPRVGIVKVWLLGE